jgi:hypothetical protein
MTKKPNTEGSTCISTLADHRQNFSKEKSAAAEQQKLFCKAGPVLRELSDSEGWRALEERGKRRSIGHATNIFISQRRKQAEGRDDSNNEKRQNRNPIRAAGVTLRDQHAQEGESDCDCRNQEPSTPLPVLHH